MNSRPTSHLRPWSLTTALCAGMLASGCIKAATAPGTAPVRATPRRLAFAEEPGSGPLGAGQFHLSVAVQDSMGNTVLTYGGPITLTLGANPGGATPFALSARRESGVADFGWLSLDRPGTGYTLVAAAAGLESATSLPFDVTPAPARPGDAEDQP